MFSKGAIVMVGTIDSIYEELVSCVASMDEGIAS